MTTCDWSEQLRAFIFFFVDFVALLIGIDQLLHLILPNKDHVNDLSLRWIDISSLYGIDLTQNFIRVWLSRVEFYLMFIWRFCQKSWLLPIGTQGILRRWALLFLFGSHHDCSWLQRLFLLRWLRLFLSLLIVDLVSQVFFFKYFLQCNTRLDIIHINLTVIRSYVGFSVPYILANLNAIDFWTFEHTLVQYC